MITLKITPGQIYSLFKPGLSIAVLFTVLPGLLLGDRLPSFGIVFYSLLGTMFVAMSAFCYNQILEIRTDALMERTRYRVLPSGALSINTVIAIGSILLICGLLTLLLEVNLLAVSIALFSFLIYIFLYTIFLKPRSEYNTIFGGLSGAVGPLIGEAAATGSVSFNGFILSWLIILWQPPHFWALAIFLRKEYANAGLPMKPVVRGIPHTIKQMFIYQILLIVSIFTVYYPMKLGGLIFIVPSELIGLSILFLIFNLNKNRVPKRARIIFHMSILHITIWHSALAIDLFLAKFI